MTEWPYRHYVSRDVKVPVPSLMEIDGKRTRSISALGIHFSLSPPTTDRILFTNNKSSRATQCAIAITVTEEAR